MKTIKFDNFVGDAVIENLAKGLEIPEADLEVVRFYLDSVDVIHAEIKQLKPHLKVPYVSNIHFAIGMIEEEEDK